MHLSPGDKDDELREEQEEMTEHIKQEWHQYLMIMHVNPMVNFTK